MKGGRLVCGLSAAELVKEMRQVKDVRRIGKHKPQAAGQIGSCTEIEMSEEEISSELANRKLNLAFGSSISFSHSL